MADWDACLARATAGPLSGRLLRLVESQEEIATTRLVSSLERQAVMATMFLSLQMLAGGLALLGCSAIAGESSAMNWTLPGSIAFLWLTVMSSCVAYSAYSYLARNTTPLLVGTYGYVNPAIAALLGWLALDEVLTVTQLAGMLVILVAIALVTGFAGRWVRLPRSAG